ncbi:conserved Plasmodium protein, unknown function [Plasmodium vinckei vinckei]|uniref:G-patch domain-containing protein n=1 Tax=Plasmodium vinckei vinckei TaxID=54757 RepID=A0A449BS33_PLAVN|nr:conserved Plasmodium protein, unknown function [Plasmodium vinckei vinckei]KEG02040.1 hypothetical protein YYE_02779 [Plasmodium vinckei vinckei]VEV56280.1 conserved Plasmodium protein, unknown function [Plasmodium vinckei vinckei]
MSKKYYEKLLCDIQNQSKPVESKFGSYILQKFGWEKGKGLGKNENGNVNIMKIKKYGEHGLGYKEHNDEQSTDGMWWENMYNNCAKKMSTNNNDKNEKQNIIDNQKIKNNKEDENVKYSIFVKKNKCIISAFCDEQLNEKEDNQNKQKNNNDFKIKEKEINKEKHKMNNHFANNNFYHKNKLNNNNNFNMNKSKNKKNGKKWNKI